MTSETINSVVLPIQVATFVILGLVLLAQHQYRLGPVQLLLAAVQAILYSGKMA